MRHFFWAAAVGLAGLPAHADDITDTLNSAIQAYEEGDIQYALEELAFAQQLLNEMRSGALAAFLPEPPDGWTREVEDDMNAMAVMGGGNGARASYSNDDTSFTLTLMTDNPMVAAMGNLFGNAALLGAQGKLVRVGREKFVEQNNQLMGLIDGRILVQAEGAEPEQMLPILELIDFRELGRFGL